MRAKSYNDNKKKKGGGEKGRREREREKKEPLQSFDTSAAAAAVMKSSRPLIPPRPLFFPPLKRYNHPSPRRMRVTFVNRNYGARLIYIERRALRCISHRCHKVNFFFFYYWGTEVYELTALPFFFVVKNFHAECESRGLFFPKYLPNLSPNKTRNEKTRYHQTNSVIMKKKKRERAIIITAKAAASQ